MCLPAISKPYQLLLNIRIVEIGKSFSSEFSFYFNTRRTAQVIIITKAILLQQLIHKLATFAAEIFIVRTDGTITVLSTVVTACEFFSGRIAFLL
jgi:hypothetical protein